MTAPIAERTRADAQWSPARYSVLCRMKRFFERYDGDAEFRVRYEQNPRRALASVAPDLALEDIRAVRSVPRHPPASIVDDVSLPPLARDYCRFVLERALRFNRLRAEAGPLDPRFRGWRRRRMLQAEDELGSEFSQMLLFSTAAFELSKGCSVGCWFCGVSAPRLEDHFRYTSVNRRLWREVLEAMIDLGGLEAMHINFCFWATDPLDNPDYEAFADDYRAIAGAYPPLTTALALRDPERTRRMLDRFDADVCRFSILTVPMLDRLHREFTPEELGGVDLALVTPGSRMIKANAGRFRERAAAHPELLQVERGKRSARREFFQGPTDRGEDVPGTIACVAGFLINMVERRVRLISPCAASERWPLGFVLYGDRRFEDGRDFRRVCEELVCEHMFTRWPAGRAVRFRPSLHFHPLGSGFELRSTHHRWSIEAAWQGAACHDLGAWINDGCHQPGELTELLLERHFVSAFETEKQISQLLREGLLDEEPPPGAATSPSQGAP